MLRRSSYDAAPSEPRLRARVEAESSLGDALAQMGRYNEAVEIFTAAVSGATALWGPDDVETWRQRINLGVVLHHAGRLEEARQELTAGASGLGAATPEGHPDRLHAAEALASLDVDQGRWAEAREALEVCLAARRTRGGAELAETLGRLGSLRYRMGDLSEAASNLQESLDIRCSLPGTPSLSSGLNNLAAVTQAAGDHARAEALFSESLELDRRTLGPDHPRVATTLNNLGLVAQALGDTDRARALFEQSAAIRASRLGPDHPQVAVVRANLGGLWLKTGASADARDAYTQALRIWTAAYGPDHPLVGEAHTGIAAASEALDDRDAARAQEALRIAALGLDLLEGLSEREALLWAGVLRARVSAWLTLFDRPEDQATAWAHVLTWKGVATRRLRARAAAARSSGDPDVATASAALGESRRRLAQLAWSVDPGDPAARRAELDRASEEKERMERALDALVPLADDPVTPEGICAALPADTALVDLVRYEHGEVAAYAAFVVDRTCAPVRVPLGQADRIEDLVSRWRALVAEPSTVSRADHEGSRLSEAVWAPIEAVLPPDTRRVVVIPDGSLARIAWGALPVAASLADPSQPRRYVLEDWSVHYVDHAADLVDRPARPGRGALVVSGVDYGPPVQGGDAACGRADFVPLPGTVAEGRAVAEAWARRGRGPVTHLFGAAATEQGVAAEASGAAVIHLATHATATPACGDGERDPLLGFGLALAAVNRDHFGRATADGFLTAEDVAARMDLEGTRLVVLSACETVGSTITNGEGVIGLRRAFVLAEAESILVTLWPVEDAVVAGWMASFYGRLRGWRPGATAEAVREAQLAALESGRGAGGWAASLQWATFVLTGDALPR